MAKATEALTYSHTCAVGTIEDYIPIPSKKDKPCALCGHFCSKEVLADFGSGYVCRKCVSESVNKAVEACGKKGR